VNVTVSSDGDVVACDQVHPTEGTTSPSSIPVATRRTVTVPASSTWNPCVSVDASGALVATPDSVGATVDVDMEVGAVGPTVDPLSPEAES
jgi:hypothetical protein